MTIERQHWKLGFFVLAGLAIALIAIVTIGVRSMHKDVGLYVSYFDESVQGLEVGAPIKFRGVRIGMVEQIVVAPDHRHVEVESAIEIDALVRLGLDIAKEPRRFGAIPKLQMSKDLRLQLASAGLTGVKFLQLDFFDVRAFPPPDLPFKVPENYIPTASSMMKNLEDSIILIANRLPEITDLVAAIASDVDMIISDLNNQQIPQQISTTLENMNQLIETTEKVIRQVDAKKLSKNANQALGSVAGAARQLDGVLVRINKDDGLITGLDQAGNAVEETLRGGDGLGGEMIETLESVQSLSRSLRKLSEAIDQDADMLLKGRSPERTP